MRKARPKVISEKHQGAESGIGSEKGFADGGGKVTKDHESYISRKFSAGDTDDGPNLGCTIRGVSMGPCWKRLFTIWIPHPKR